ncbi:MAG: efflux RND transporter periplasmic adaptor subunit [Deltaproteobacteria bacterium]|nr:efflux RND transporter periplasmic adaptor subunit [Deltaproteobacteria bacterium]
MIASPFLRRALGVARRSRWIVLLLGAALTVAWLRVWSAVAAESARVDRGTIIHEAFGRGTIESQREAAVGFDLVGRLSAVLVEEGARVTLGQELARLETSQAQADLRWAQTGIDAARASLQRLAAEEDRVRSLLVTAERETTRTQALFDQGAVTAQQRDEASDRLRIARADLDRLLAQRSEATRGVDVAVGGAEQRRVAMVRATLLAPFDGLVTRRLRDPGDTVTIGSTVLRLVDTARVYVNAAVDETMLPLLTADQPAAIDFPGPGTPVAGRVSRISWEADRQTHEIMVEVTPLALDRRVAIGQRADVRIEVGRREGVLRAPIRMIHRDDGGAYVYADRGGKITVVRPKFGLTGNEFVEVLEGLAEGDTVIAAPGTAVALPAGRRWEDRRR